MSQPNDEEIESEIDGDLELLRSSDSRYIELRLYSTDPIEAGAFLAVIEQLAQLYAHDPEAAFETFGRAMPAPSDMN